MEPPTSSLPRFVVDASVAVKWHLGDEDDTAAAAAATTPDRPAWVWRTLRLERIWKGDLPLDGEPIEALQDTRFEPELRPDGRYVLFLQAQSGQPWRIVCDQLTVAEVDGDRVIHRNGASQAQPVWLGGTLADLKRQLAPFTGSSWGPMPAATPAR